MKKNYFQFSDIYENQSILKILSIITLMLVPGAIIGTGFLNLLLIFFDILFLFFLFKNYKIINISQKYIFFISAISLLLVINLLLSTQFDLTLQRSLNIVKFIFFILGFAFLLENSKKLNQLFLLVLFCSVFFVAIDCLYQYFFLFDFFGYKSENISPGEIRLTGPFKDELVPGSFISKLSFLSIFFLINFNKKYLSLFVLFFFIIITILTNERMASIMLMFCTIFYLLFFNKSKLKNLLFISIFLMTTFLLIFNNSNLKERFFTKTLLQIGNTKSNFFNSTGNIFGSQYYGHFHSSILIFKDNFIFGSGLNTFRIECGKDSYSRIIKIPNRCSTHPHNFYFEILSDTGLVGLFFFTYMIYFFLKKIFIIKSREKKIISFTIFLLLFWPIKTTGSIFSSWNGFLYAINIGYILYLINYDNLKNKIKQFN